jgi:hypothetical protein
MAGGAGNAAAQATAGRIVGDRYSTLQGLAEYVDDGAQFALDEATETLTSPGVRERALLTSLRDFARQARVFHNRVDDYELRPWRVESEIPRLRTAARRVNLRLRRVAAMRETFEDWDLVLSDIADMQRLVAGSDVDLRRPDPEWDADIGHQHPAERPAYGPDPLEGTRLDEFQRLSRDLATQAARVYEMARTQRTDYSQNGTQMLQDLQHFVQQTADIQNRAEANQVRPRDIGPLVTHVLEDARRADASMRKARVFMNIWTEWGEAIQVMEQLNKLVR